MTDLKRRPGLVLLAAVFILAGLNHFWNPRIYRAIMPPYLPAHGPLVFWSGVAEVVLGAAVLVPRLRKLAGWGLIALLVAVFPANLYMAQNAERFRAIPEWALWARLPFQLVFAWWVKRSAIDE